jgi:hypothetical protein
MLAQLKGGLFTVMVGVILVLFVMLSNSCRREELGRAKLDAAKADVSRLEGGIASQKREAAAELRAANASALALQRAIDDGRAEQEKNDVKNREISDGLRGELRDLRTAQRLQRAAEAARRSGGGGGGAPNPAGAAAGDSAGSAAEASRLFPAPAAGAGDVDSLEDFDAYEADIINLAYASCRADGLRLRSLMAPAAPRASGP